MGLMASAVRVTVPGMPGIDRSPRPTTQVTATLTAAELADDAAGYCPDDVTGPEALRAFGATIRGIAETWPKQANRDWERAMAEAHPELLPEYIRKWGDDKITS